MSGSDDVTRADAVVHAEVRTRRFRVSATVAVTVESTPSPRPHKRAGGWVPLGLQDPGVRWGDLPPRVLPEEWIGTQGDGSVPATVVITEDERGPNGYAPAG